MTRASLHVQEEDGEEGKSSLVQGKPWSKLMRYNFCLPSVNKTSTCAKGQLKLAVYADQGLITVHVFRARRLSTEADTYVKVSLLPGSHTDSSHQTDTAYSSCSPVYDQKLTIELQKEDRKKRLEISLCQTAVANRSSSDHVIGTMSFGVKHLLGCASSDHSSRKGVKGWYQLLTGELGKRKHLPLSTKKMDSTGRSPLALKKIPEVNKDVKGMDSFTIVVKKERKGYGFTVIGTSPVTVGRVDSAAESAGLFKDDCIVRLNGQNVSRSTADSVAKLVRHSSKQVILDVQRPAVADYSSASLCPQRSILPLAPLQLANTSLPPTDPNFTMENRPLYAACKNQLEPVPELDSQGSEEEQEDLWSSVDELPTAVIEGDFRTNLVTSTPYVILGLDSLCSADETQPDLSETEMERQRLVQLALGCEVHFTNMMQFGIQRYSRPLRYCFLSAAEHTMLFQNIEKLVAISECLVRSLEEGSCDYFDMDHMQQTYIDIVGGVYQPKVQIMCAAYEAYCNGLGGAVQLLEELCDYNQFQEFLNEEPLESDQPTISEFIQKPLHHMKAMFLNLQAVMSCTPSKHIDLAAIQEVTKALAGCSTRLENIQNEPCTSMISSLFRSSGLRSSGRSSGQSSAHSAESLASIDTEVFNLQNRLLFPRHVKNFQLVTPSRHIIYSGELKLQTEGKQWLKLWVVLLSDMLLLTRNRPDIGCLEVVQAPLLLQDIITYDFAVASHPSQFVLAVELQQRMRFITLAAPSIEQKSTWRNILAQRIHAQRELMTCRLADNIV